MSIAKKLLLKIKKTSSGQQQQQQSACAGVPPQPRRTQQRRKSSLTRSLKRLRSPSYRPPTVSDLVGDKNWDCLREALKTDGARDEIIGASSPSSSSSSSECEGGETAVQPQPRPQQQYLHDALRLGAPLDIISTIFELLDYDDPAVSALSQRDAMGRTPLMIACGAYRDEAITYPSAPCGPTINFLLASSMDNSSSTTTDISSTVNDEDDYDSTALECAILSGVRYSTVNRLRKASERAWKANASATEDETGATAAGGGPVPPAGACCFSSSRKAGAQAA